MTSNIANDKLNSNSKDEYMTKSTTNQLIYHECNQDDRPNYNQSPHCSIKLQQNENINDNQSNDITKRDNNSIDNKQYE